MKIPPNLHRRRTSSHFDIDWHNESIPFLSHQVWDLATGACVRSIRHASTVNACAFSADGARLVSACYDSTLKVWDVATALNVFSLTGHTGAVNGVVYMVRWCSVFPRFPHPVAGVSFLSSSAVFSLLLLSPLFLALRVPLRPVCAAAGSSRLTAAPDRRASSSTAPAIALTAAARSHSPPLSPIPTPQPDGTIVSAADDTTVRTWGYPPLYRWLAGLQLEAFYPDIAAKLRSKSGGAAAGDAGGGGAVRLEALEQLQEVDLAELGMTAAQATRFSDYLLRLSEGGWRLPAVDPQEELRRFVAGFIGAHPPRAPAQAPARLLSSPTCGVCGMCDV